MILRWKGNNYKVLSVRSPGRNIYHFQCLNIVTKKTQTLHFRLEGFLEAADVAFKTMKKPQDIFLLDMDNHAKAIVATEKQISRMPGNIEQGLTRLVLNLKRGFAVWFLALWGTCTWALFEFFYPHTYTVPTVLAIWLLPVFRYYCL